MSELSIILKAVGIGIFFFVSLYIIRVYVYDKETEHDLNATLPITVKIENCEYLKNPTSNTYVVYTHKGNCSNPIHRCCKNETK